MRDATGRILSTRHDVGAMTTVESTEYDDLGRTISTTDVLGRITRTEYSQNQLAITEVLPSGATLVTKGTMMALSFGQEERDNGKWKPRLS